MSVRKYGVDGKNRNATALSPQVLLWTTSKTHETFLLMLMPRGLQHTGTHTNLFSPKIMTQTKCPTFSSTHNDQNSWCEICLRHLKMDLHVAETPTFLQEEVWGSLLLDWEDVNAFSFMRYKRPFLLLLVVVVSISIFMSLPLNTAHVHLLNIVDPIHRIVYFLPSWWKFCKEKKEKEKSVRWRKIPGCWVTGGHKRQAQ